MSDPETTDQTPQQPAEDVPAPAVTEPTTEPDQATLEASIPSLTVRVEVDAEKALAAVTTAATGLLDRIHAEVDVLWGNVFANVSSRVETPIHNYLESEIQALKARIVALF